MNDDILGVIPARSGSKGLPDKNIKPLHDKPLIGWSIQQAAASEHLDHFVLSTDSEEYGEIGREHGAPVPFIRPPEFATDESPTSDVLMHALQHFRDQGHHFDTVLLLEPTSPLRRPGDIDRAIDLFHSNALAEAVISIGEIQLEHPYIAKVVDDDGFVSPLLDDSQAFHQRQQLPEVYFPYGIIYISDVETFEEEETFYHDRTAGYEIERWQHYEIDDIYDFIVVERILQQMETEVEGHP